MARLIIADLTHARSVLQELQRLVPSLPSVPVKAIILATDARPGMVDHFDNFRSFLALCRYTSPAALIDGLETEILVPLEKFIEEQRK
jgi:hypothetical protein